MKRMVSVLFFLMFFLVIFVVFIYHLIQLIRHIMMNGETTKRKP